MGDYVTLTAADGHRLEAYRSDPRERPKGGVVVLQEAFGVNAHIRSVCDDFAGAGYAVLAPALYDRQQPRAAFGYDEAALQAARRLRRGLDYAKVMLDVAAAVAALRPHGRVGVVGYCVGGSAAWLAACRLGIDAAACYYASDLGQQLDETPRCPVVMHFAERDHFVTPEVAAAFRARHPAVPAFSYPADHGFNCADRPHGYHAESAALARERTLALFARHLAAA